MSTDNPDKPQARKRPKEERAERQAAALRANLHRRKAQSRGQAARPSPESSDEPPDPEKT